MNIQVGRSAVCAAALAALLAGCGRREPAGAAAGPATETSPATGLADSAAAAPSGASGPASTPASAEPGTAASPPTVSAPARPSRGLTTLPREYAEAAMNGMEELIDRVIREGLLDANAVGEQGRTMLMLAAFNGHTTLCRRLIGYGADVNRRDESGRTALMYAATGPNVDTVRVLLDAGADVNAADRGERWTALMFAAAEGQTEVVRLLLDRGADPELRDADQDRAIEFARNNGHHETVRLLEEASARRADRTPSAPAAPVP